MKLQIKTSFIPLTRLGKIVSWFARTGKPIESHVGKISLRFQVLEGKPSDNIQVFYEMRSQALMVHRHFHKNWVSINLTLEEPYTWALTYPKSGLTELRLYIKGLTEDDILLDDHGSESGYTKKTQDQRPEVPNGSSYYLRLFRIYSYYDLLLFFFALVSGIGALFEIMNFFYTVFS